MSDEPQIPDELWQMFKRGEVYIARSGIDHCRVCGEEDDLRMGACFACADFVDGERVKGTTGGHKLWDRRNPENYWYAVL